MRIFGVNIPDEKRIDVSLRYLYGIGGELAKRTLAATKIDPARRAKELSAEEIAKLQGFIEKNFRVEGDLRQVVKRNIGRLKDLQTYRGMRHSRRLPVRGQRTRTNARTRKGPRKGAVAAKKKVAARK